MIKLTEKAISKAKELAEAEGLPPSIRIVIRGGGCSGLTPDMSLDDITTDMDDIIDQDGVKIIIDCFSSQHLDEATVDFIETEFSRGFKFIMKDDKMGSCGCGSSIGYK